MNSNIMHMNDGDIIKAGLYRLLSNNEISREKYENLLSIIRIEIQYSINLNEFEDNSDGN